MALADIAEWLENRTSDAANKKHSNTLVGNLDE
jgi:hypothetical protein